MLHRPLRILQTGLWFVLYSPILISARLLGQRASLVAHPGRYKQWPGISLWRGMEHTVLRSVLVILRHSLSQTPCANPSPPSHLRLQADIEQISDLICLSIEVVAALGAGSSRTYTRAVRLSTAPTKQGESSGSRSAFPSACPSRRNRNSFGMVLVP